MKETKKEFCSDYELIKYLSNIAFMDELCGIFTEVFGEKMPWDI